MKKLIQVSVLCSVIATVAILPGCSSSEAPPASTAAEVKAFQGGPMPASARKDMEAIMKGKGKKANPSIGVNGG